MSTLVLCCTCSKVQVSMIVAQTSESMKEVGNRDCWCRVASLARVIGCLAHGRIGLFVPSRAQQQHLGCFPVASSISTLSDADRTHAHARTHKHTHACTHARTRARARTHTHRRPHQHRIQSLCRLGCGWGVARHPRSVGYQERAERGGAPSPSTAWGKRLGLKPRFHSRFTGVTGCRDGWHPVGVGCSCGQVSRSAAAPCART